MKKQILFHAVHETTTVIGHQHNKRERERFEIIAQLLEKEKQKHCYREEEKEKQC